MSLPALWWRHRLEFMFQPGEKTPTAYKFQLNTPGIPISRGISFEKRPNWQRKSCGKGPTHVRLDSELKFNLPNQPHRYRYEEAPKKGSHSTAERVHLPPRTAHAPDWVVIIIYTRGWHDSRLTTHLRPDLIAIAILDLRTRCIHIIPPTPGPKHKFYFAWIYELCCRQAGDTGDWDLQGREVGENNELRLLHLLLAANTLNKFEE